MTTPHLETTAAQLHAADQRARELREQLRAPMMRALHRFYAWTVTHHHPFEFGCGAKRAHVDPDTGQVTGLKFQFEGVWRDETGQLHAYFTCEHTSEWDSCDGHDEIVPPVLALTDPDHWAFLETLRPDALDHSRRTRR